MKIEKYNSRFFGVSGKAGKRKELEVLISNEAGVWELIVAINSGCVACAAQDSCEYSGCFSHPKINEKTQVKCEVGNDSSKNA